MRVDEKFELGGWKCESKELKRRKEEANLNNSAKPQEPQQHHRLLNLLQIVQLFLNLYLSLLINKKVETLMQSLETFEQSECILLHFFWNFMEDKNITGFLDSSLVLFTSTGFFSTFLSSR